MSHHRLAAEWADDGSHRPAPDDGTATAASPEHPRPAALRNVVIEPMSRKSRLALSEAWQARELAGYLVWRDIKVRYKQTVLGASWAIIQPLATAAIFTIVFGRLADVPSDGAPYVVFALAALAPWTALSNALNQGGNALVNNLSMITKVYVPRLLLPVSACLASAVDLALSTLVVLVAAVVFDVPLTVRLLLLPLFAVLALVVAVGASLFLSALNLQYRDVRHLLPFLLQMMLFVSPVAYSSRSLDGDLRLLYALNPAVGVIDGFRWAVLGTDDPGLPGVLAVSTGAALLLFALGLRYFRRREAAFADVA